MNQTYYDEKLATLPENLQYAVRMSDWENHLVKIKDQFKLHIDQTQVLEDAAIKLMFGDINATEFINKMFTEAHINSELAADILLEIDLKILKNIRERLELLEEAEKEDEVVENFLLGEEERNARKENEDFANYYAEIEKIREEDEASPEEEVEEEIPTDIEKERGDLLKEINDPTKSFTETRPITQHIEVKPIETKPVIDTDHQIENIHLEKPLKVEEKPITQDNQIKKPININLNDIYREPIE